MCKKEISKEVIEEWKRFLESDECRHNTECGTLLIAQHFAEWGKEQMMKDAITVKVEKGAGGYLCIQKYIEPYDMSKDLSLADEGDEFKVIFVKEK